MLKVQVTGMQQVFWLIYLEMMSITRSTILKVLVFILPVAFYLMNLVMILTIVEMDLDRVQVTIGL